MINAMGNFLEDRFYGRSLHVARLHLGACMHALLILGFLVFIGLSVIWINYLLHKRKERKAEPPEELELSERIRKVLKGENK